MNNSNREKLSAEMQNGISVENLTELCREIIYDEVSSQCKSDSMKEYLRKLCEVVNIPVQIKEVLLSAKITCTKPVWQNMMGYSFCGVAYYLLYRLSSSHLLGGIACVGTGILYNKYTNENSKKQTLNSQSASRTVICSTVKELEEKLDCYIAILYKLMNLSRNISSLIEFLYDSYKSWLAVVDENRNAVQMERIKLLLEEYGYELVEYSEDNSTYFNFSTANVQQKVMTIPGLIEGKTKKCVYKGHVLLPLS